MSKRERKVTDVGRLVYYVNTYEMGKSLGFRVEIGKVVEVEGDNFLIMNLKTKEEVWRSKFNISWYR